jgi:aspartate aminotransferase
MALYARADLAASLLEEVQVAVVPGEAFGAPGCLRLCFAAVGPTLDKALAGLTAALRALAPDSARRLLTTARR